jgi:ubiquinone biosynthesis protein
VMERIHGVMISDLDELRRRGTNFQRLAENGVEIFFTQVFRHNFFHADMHPGNVFVQIDDPEFPRYAAVDFGIVGTLAPRDQHYLAENFMAFFDRDYRRVAQLHVDSGWVPAGTRVDELEAAVRTVCEPIFNKPLKEISFGQVLIRLFETAQRFEMTVQPQLILLQKTLLQIEGLGRQLYPDLDLWKTAQPVLREWMQTRYSVRAVVKSVRTQLPDLVEALKLTPQLLQSTIQRAAEGRLRLPVQTDHLEEMRREAKASADRRDATILSAAAGLSGVLWFALVLDPKWPGVALFAAAIVNYWYSRRRT